MWVALILNDEDEYEIDKSEDPNLMEFVDINDEHGSAVNGLEAAINEAKRYMNETMVDKFVKDYSTATNARFATDEFAVLILIK